MSVVATIALILGGVLCAVNFYLSFLRRPLHRILRGDSDDFKWVSGFPVVGSVLVALSLLRFHEHPVLVIVAIAFIVIDTGGVHWFAGSMLYNEVLRKKSSV